MFSTSQQACGDFTIVFWPCARPFTPSYLPARLRRRSIEGGGGNVISRSVKRSTTVGLLYKFKFSESQTLSSLFRHRFRTFRTFAYICILHYISPKKSVNNYFFVQNSQCGLTLNEAEWDEEWRCVLRLASPEPRSSSAMSSSASSNG